MGNPDRPLAVYVKDDELVIRIGIKTLAWAFDHEEGNNVWDQDRELFIQSWKVSDPQVFAEEVAIAMNSEEENGATPVTEFFDKMCYSALDDGAMGIEEYGQESEIQ
jgi:hypothetical protein